MEGHKFISFIITVTCLPSLNKGVSLPLPYRRPRGLISGGIFKGKFTVAEYFYTK